jgi:5'-methylthioadenosine phosphorylase
MAGMTGIIGGTGLYRLEGVEVLERQEHDTPFGRPSAPVTIGRIGTRRVAFLPRHGEQHTLTPSEINFRANIWAMKAAGAREIISVSATGSLREDLRPGELVMPSQYFDWTRGRRAGTFFGDGIVAHISAAEPTCPELVDRVVAAGARVGVSLQTGGTYACVEGPRLGTRAESFFLRGAGCDLVGMTNVPEAFLAREAQLSYATLAVVTDYDCWKDDPTEHASVELVFARYRAAIVEVMQVLQAYLSAPEGVDSPPARSALAGAVLTPAEAMSPEQRRIVAFLTA